MTPVDVADVERIATAAFDMGHKAGLLRGILVGMIASFLLSPAFHRLVTASIMWGISWRRTQ